MKVIVEIGRFMTLFYEPFSLGLIFSTSLQQVKALEFLVRIIASKSLYLSFLRFLWALQDNNTLVVFFTSADRSLSFRDKS